MRKYSFEDIGSVTATFAADEGVKGGQVVKLTGSDTVGPCKAGDAFCGMALEPRQGRAAVQVKGFLTAPCTGALTPGWAILAADGNGGVKSAETGVTALVVHADTDSAVICL